MNYVLELSPEKTNFLIDYYASARDKTHEEHIRARFRLEGLIVTVYASGKVMFQGKRAEETYFFWCEVFAIVPIDKKAPKKTDFFTPSIGSDESGVGDYFGPLTVCAVYVDEKTAKRIEPLGVRDSKTIADKEVKRLAKKLLTILPASLMVLDNERYNSLVEEGYNAHRLKAWLHAQSHKKLIQRIKKRPLVIVDKFCEKKTYMAYLKDFENPEKPDRFLFRAEEAYASVAAASIIARHAFLEELAKMSYAYGVDFPKGASSAVEEAGRAFIGRHGEETLKKVAKIHFRTTEKMRTTRGKHHG